jgi:hypothetical protein
VGANSKKSMKKMKKLLAIVLIFNLKNVVFTQITTYSGSYGVTGVNLDQPEIQFNLETTYESNERFTQLYRWRYAMGQYGGLLFEYNNRLYFGSDRDFDNSKWFIQGKIGYGRLKGITYSPGSIAIYDPFGNYIGSNTSNLVGTKNTSLIYGLSLGYKFIMADRITLDFSLGYTGYTLPNFDADESQSSRIYDWQNGIAYPVEFGWSLGFLLD